MKLVKINGQDVQYAEFTSYAAAQSHADNSKGVKLILLGDNNRFWVAGGRCSSRLRKAGYELA